MGENRLNDIKKQKRNIRIFSSNALKIIACVSMLIDHIGIVFVDNNLFMRAVGRLAFPVFAFLLVQGLLRTSDVRRYLLRLGIFAVVSEMPFDLAMHDTIWYPGAQNIFFTLTAGLFAIYAMDSRGPIGRWKVEIALAAALLAEFLRFDYGMAGVGIIVMFYLIEKERSGADVYTLAYFNKKQNIEIVVLSSLVYILCLGMNQLYALLAMIPVNMYSGEKRKDEAQVFLLSVLSPAFAAYMVYMEKKCLLNRIIDGISGILLPVVNVLSAAGTLKGILVLAYSSAKKFGANKYVAVVVAGVSMYPVLNTVLESGQTVHFLGIPLLR